MDETMNQFVDRFERCYQLIIKCKNETNVPNDVRAFMLSRRARTMKTERMIVLSKVKLKGENKIFDTMCKELKEDEDKEEREA